MKSHTTGDWMSTSKSAGKIDPVIPFCTALAGWPSSWDLPHYNIWAYGLQEILGVLNSVRLARSGGTASRTSAEMLSVPHGNPFNVHDNR